MSYNYLTQFDSPNYTPNSQTASVWGRGRAIQAIAIHWWGDPNQNPSFEGVVAYLCRPNGNSSAHFVTTGTERRVACIVSPLDNAWATNSANPTTIAIELDPRCRDEDYDVAAELIADIRSAYGAGLTLVPHRQFTATACPGNYDLGRLDAIANTKVSHADWGAVTTKGEATTGKVTREQLVTLYGEILERDPDEGAYAHYVGKRTYDFTRTDLLNSTERSILVNRKAAEQAAKVEAERKAAEERAKKDKAEADRIAAEKEAQEKAKEQAAKNAGYTQADRDRDNSIKALLDKLVEWFKQIFKVGQ